MYNAATRRLSDFGKYLGLESLALGESGYGGLTFDEPHTVADSSQPFAQPSTFHRTSFA